MAGYTYTGASGRDYSFQLFSPADLSNLPMQGGNYIFALNDGSRSPIYIEAANSMRASVMHGNMELWNIARTVHGAQLVLIQMQAAADAAGRETDKEDLIAAYHPPMNPAPDPAQ